MNLIIEKRDEKGTIAPNLPVAANGASCRETVYPDNLRGDGNTY
jgi:hypothetical protein